MSEKKRFSLETLSKIGGAKPSDEVLEFFDILDEHISDEQVTQYMKEQHEKTVPVDRLRSDTPHKDEQIASTRKQIIANFPKSKETAIEVPQIV